MDQKSKTLDPKVKNIGPKSQKHLTQKSKTLDPKIKNMHSELHQTLMAINVVVLVVVLLLLLLLLLFGGVWVVGWCAAVGANEPREPALSYHHHHHQNHH